MSYGSPEWQSWVLGEEESIKQIKFAWVPDFSSPVSAACANVAARRYDFGVQTFDTANVYSNGLSEVVLGKAIKQHNLPREEIVVMTKVRIVSTYNPPCLTFILGPRRRR